MLDPLLKMLLPRIRAVARPVMSTPSPSLLVIAFAAPAAVPPIVAIAVLMISRPSASLPSIVFPWIVAVPPVMRIAELRAPVSRLPSSAPVPPTVVLVPFATMLIAWSLVVSSVTAPAAVVPIWLLRMIVPVAVVSIPLPLLPAIVFSSMSVFKEGESRLMPVSPWVVSAVPFVHRPM